DARPILGVHGGGPDRLGPVHVQPDADLLGQVLRAVPVPAQPERAPAEPVVAGSDVLQVRLLPVGSHRASSVSTTLTDRAGPGSVGCYRRLSPAAATATRPPSRRRSRPPRAGTAPSAPWPPPRRPPGRS